MADRYFVLCCPYLCLFFLTSYIFIFSFFPSLPLPMPSSQGICLLAVMATAGTTVLGVFQWDTCTCIPVAARLNLGVAWGWGYARSIQSDYTLIFLIGGLIELRLYLIDYSSWLTFNCSWYVTDFVQLIFDCWIHAVDWYSTDSTWLLHVLPSFILLDTKRKCLVGCGRNQLTQNWWLTA